MKTNILKPIILLLSLGGFMTMQAQGLYNLATLDDEYEDSPLKWSSGIDFGYDDVSDKFDKGVGWADATAGGGLGFGIDSIEGESTTSFCLSGEVSKKIWGEDQNPNGAGYVSLYGNYHKTNSDNLDENFLQVGAGVTYFDRITALNEVQLLYGVKAFYETGKRDFSGLEDDFNGYGLYFFTGVNFRVCNNTSIGLEVPVVSYLSRTFESNGSDFTQDKIWGGVNKDNIVSANIRWVIDNAEWVVD